MVFTQRKTPARLASPAARKLPRQYLFWFMFAYIIAGLFGRDPWKTDDVAGLASMLSSLESGHWFTAYLDHVPYIEHGPLTNLIGAGFIWLFSPFFALFVSPLDANIMAARLPNLLYFFTMMWAVWYGTYLLARRPEAQPLPLPFGGEPHPRDYGRMLADVAFFFMLATAGLVIRIHETRFYPLMMAIHAMAFYGFVRLLDHPTQGSLVLGVMMAAALMTQGVVGILPLLLFILLIFCTRVYAFRLKIFLGLSLIFAALLTTIWLGSLYDLDPVWIRLWWQEQGLTLSLTHWTQAFSNLRDLAWFLLPSWPFALIALWQWRKWWDVPHLFIPTSLALVYLLTIFSTREAFEADYGPLSIAISVLAAMAIPTLKRHTVNLLDWYSIMVVSLGLIAIWLGWSALYLGFPAQIHHNIMRLVPDMDRSLNYLHIGVALVICFLWYRLVAWRLRKNPKAMWRGIVLSAAGTIISWVLLSVLWLGAIDYNRSYREVGLSLSKTLHEKIKDGQCIQGINLGQGQLASFYLFAKLRLSHEASCPYAFVQTSIASVEQNTYAYHHQAKILWQGQRRTERHGETFLLLDLHP